MDQQMVAFREWYNAQWLGDQEHGQYIPHNGDPKYTEYLDGHMLALGAWMACLQYNGVAANVELTGGALAPSSDRRERG